MRILHLFVVMVVAIGLMMAQGAGQEKGSPRVRRRRRRWWINRATAEELKAIPGRCIPPRLFADGRIREKMNWFRGGFCCSGCTKRSKTGYWQSRSEGAQCCPNWLALAVGPVETKGLLRLSPASRRSRFPFASRGAVQTQAHSSASSSAAFSSGGGSKGWLSHVIKSL